MPYAAGAATGVILSAVYLLWMYQRTFLGAKPAESIADLNFREAIVAAPLLFLMLWMGIASSQFLSAQSAVTAQILEKSKMNVEFRVSADRIEDNTNGQ
jgi:NADH-quinone oxidoreductase subunit M